MTAPQSEPAKVCSLCFAPLLVLRVFKPVREVTAFDFQVPRCDCLSTIGGVDMISRGLAGSPSSIDYWLSSLEFPSTSSQNLNLSSFLVTSATGWLKACSPHGWIIVLSNSCFWYEGVPSFTTINQGVSLNRGVLDCPPDGHPVLSHGPRLDWPNSEVQFSQFEMPVATRPF
jgi:hypothetical protein